MDKLNKQTSQLFQIQSVIYIVINCLCPKNFTHNVSFQKEGNESRRDVEDEVEAVEVKRARGYYVNFVKYIGFCLTFLISFHFCKINLESILSWN